MVTNSQLFLFAVLSTRSATVSSSNDFDHQTTVASYIVSLVKYLAAHQTGTFDCWLYHVYTDPGPVGKSRLMQEISVGLDGEYIPKLATNAEFNWTTVHNRERQPSLVVMHLEVLNGNRTVWGNIGYLLGTLARQTRIVMLARVHQWPMLRNSFMPAFIGDKLYNVVFLFIDEPLAIAPHFMQGRYYNSDTLWPPEHMFPDQVRSFEGSPFRFSLAQADYLNFCNFTTGECSGYDVSIAMEIAKYLNATAQFVRFVCPYEADENDNTFNCIRAVAYDSECPFDIFIETATCTELERAYVEAPIPFDNVFLAPCGRSLNIAELFIRPFQIELWILLIVVMISIKVAFVIVANDFKNDPLFLPICGFEQFNLSQTSRKEKLVMLSLIVLFFFISNAYETKIISLMSRKPRVHLVRTFENIIESKTKVKAEHLLAKSFPLFESLYDVENISVGELDGTSVYLVNGDVGLQLVQRVMNWDYESNQPRYRIMDERLAMGVAFYPVPVRSPARSHYQFVLKALHESGILMHWRRDYIALNNVKRFPMIKPGGINPASEILHFADLIPAWFVALFGSLLSSGVFLIEAVYLHQF